MTKEELLDKLNTLEADNTYVFGGKERIRSEEVHLEADELLLEYINDDDIRQAFEKLRKWYA
jgi:hypothetical protein